MSEEQTQYEANTGGRVTSGPQQALQAIAEVSGHYAVIPEELLYTANLPAIILYGVLDRIARNGDGYASQTTLADRTGLSKPRIKRARDFLVQEGWVEIVRLGVGHRSTDYHLPFQSERVRGSIANPSDSPQTTNQSETSNQRLVTKDKETKETHVSLSKKEPTGVKEISGTEVTTPSEETDASPPYSAPPPSPKRVTEVDYEFRVKMATEFGDALSGRDEVDNQINQAIAHKSHKGYDGKQQHVRNWLKNAVKFKAQQQPRASPSPSIQIPEGSRHGPDAYALQEAKRRAEASTEKM